MTPLDPSVILSALIGAVPAVIALWYKMHRDGKKIDKVHDEVKTNHGKRLGEYVEEIASQVKTVSTLLVAHTLQDELHFAHIEQHLKRQDEGTNAPTTSEQVPAS